MRQKIFILGVFARNLAMQVSQGSPLNVLRRELERTLTGQRFEECVTKEGRFSEGTTVHDSKLCCRLLAEGHACDL